MGWLIYANEDKDDIARPLAEKLRSFGLEVWYDEYSLRLGDSLRKSIDKGLVESDFGIIILSKNFFSKEWPQKELDGLFALEEGEKKVIIPIWHSISKAEVIEYSPMLAGRVAANTNEGLDIVVKKILNAMDPEADFFISKDAVVKVSQSEIIINTDEWVEENNFTILNMSNHPLHDVAIDIMFEDPQIHSNDLIFKLVERTNIASGTVGSIEVDGEMFGLGIEDNNGHEHMELHLFQLGPHEHKTILIKPLKKFNTPVSIRVSVANFSIEPGKIFYI